VGQEEGKLIAVRQLIQEGFKPPVLIFVQSIKRAKELFHELIYDGINVDIIHSERTKAQVALYFILMKFYMRCCYSKCVLFYYREIQSC